MKQNNIGNMKKSTIIILFFIIAKIVNSYSQDFHYSQFYNQPLNYNPSLTGIFNGDQRFILSLKDQYRSIAPAYFSFSGSYDMKIPRKSSPRNLFAAGATFNYDKQGYSKLNLFNLNISGSYSYFINNKNILTLGALLGIANRGFDENDLTWDSNWDPVSGKYVPGSDSHENFSSFRYSYLETGLGLNYIFKKSSRTHLTLGVSGFHLTSPNMNFYNVNTDKLDPRISLLAILNMKLIDQLDLQVDFLHQQQDVYKEDLIGALVKLYLNDKIDKKLSFHLGAVCRLGEGFAPKLAIEYNQWYVAMNYDIVTKKNLSGYANFRGGPEFHVRYIISKVKPLDQFKICPIY